MQQSLFAMAVPEPVTEKVESVTDKKLTEVVFTVIDTETTGLSAKKNSLTEVTAIQYKNGEEVAKFSTLVKPTEVIPPEVEALTGISNEMVQQAPPLITVLGDLCAFVGPNPVIVGHNVGFDIRFIQEKLEQAGLSAQASRFDITRAFCTKALAVKLFPGLPSYEGIVVATHCGIHNPNPHRAESDVRMSAGILFHIIDRLKEQAQTVQALLDYQGPLS